MDNTKSTAISLVIAAVALAVIGVAPTRAKAGAHAASAPQDTRTTGDYVCDGRVVCEPDSKCVYEKKHVDADSADRAIKKLVADCQKTHGSDYKCENGSVRCEETGR